MKKLSTLILLIALAIVSYGQVPKKGTFINSYNTCHRLDASGTEIGSPSTQKIKVQVEYQDYGYISITFNDKLYGFKKSDIGKEYSDGTIKGIAYTIVNVKDGTKLNIFISPNLVIIMSDKGGYAFTINNLNKS